MWTPKFASFKGVRRKKLTPLTFFVVTAYVPAMPLRRKNQNAYHHGDLATALLQAVEDLAEKFGLEAISLRACAKALGVSPAAAFKHYADKRALLTAFAANALGQMADTMLTRREDARTTGTDPFLAVGLGYIEFALSHPAKFQLMWRRDLIDERDENFAAAREAMQNLLADGFAQSVPDQDAASISSQELLAWSSVHGLAGLMIEGPVARGEPMPQKLNLARSMLEALSPALSSAA